MDVIPDQPGPGRAVPWGIQAACFGPLSEFGCAASGWNHIVLGL
jgi:hypothetical protein